MGETELEMNPSAKRNQLERELSITKNKLEDLNRRFAAVSRRIRLDISTNPKKDAKKYDEIVKLRQCARTKRTTLRKALKLIELQNLYNLTLVGRVRDDAGNLHFTKKCSTLKGVHRLRNNLIRKMVKKRQLSRNSEHKVVSLGSLND